MTKHELVDRLRDLAERRFFGQGRLHEGLEACKAMAIDPPPRLLIRCGCALFREGKYLEAARAFALAPRELAQDHLESCRAECLAGRQVAAAVAIARMEGICIRAELLRLAPAWMKQGHVRDAMAAYEAAGVAVPAAEFMASARVFQLLGQLGNALDAYEAAKTPPPAKDLRDWLSRRPAAAGDPWLEMRVIETLLRDSRA